MSPKPPRRLRDKDLGLQMDARAILHLIGGALIVVPVLVFVPLAGGGSGASHRLGSDLQRFFSVALMTHRPLVIAALAMVGLGILLLLVSRLF